MHRYVKMPSVMNMQTTMNKKLFFRAVLLMISLIASMKGVMPTVRKQLQRLRTVFLENLNIFTTNILIVTFVHKIKY